MADKKRLRHDDQLPTIIHGKDEMNLADFPFVRLGRNDTRGAIVYEGWITDQEGRRIHQRWEAQGGSLVGLPTEFDQRVYTMLMYLTEKHGFAERKVPFSFYELEKLLGLRHSGRNYQLLEQSLDRLRNLTLKAQGAFWDNERRQHVRTLMSFNLIDKYWIRARETNEDVLEQEDGQAYIIWGEDIYRSFQSGYLKPLNITFYLALDKPIARTLYRFLDKRLRRRDSFEIDIFDLANRIGLARYEYPAHIRRRLKPACTELIERGFLASAKSVKVGKYTRMRFVKAGADVQLIQAPLDPIVQELIGCGISQTKAEDLAHRFEVDLITAKIELLEWKRDPSTTAGGRPITNPAAWLIRAIENDFQPPAGFTTRAQRETQRHQFSMDLDQAARDQATARADALRVQAEAREEYGTGEREREAWRQVTQALRLRIAQATYTTWMKEAQLLTLTEDTAIIGVPTDQHGEWLNQRLKDEIAEQIAVVVGTVLAVKFETVERQRLAALA